ncbi:MAG: hypothetical protein ACP5OG_04720 [Candidatus Nanoarchaeia archaeon]
MGWFNKKEEKQELPTLPDFPANSVSNPPIPPDYIPQDSQEPQYQNTGFENNFSQTPDYPSPENNIIQGHYMQRENEDPFMPQKENTLLTPSINEQSKNLPDLNNLIAKRPLSQEIEENNFSQTQKIISAPKQKEESLPVFKENTQNYMSQTKERKEEKSGPVYVRLDKFQSSMEMFEEIKEKVEEIDDLLKKTREIKQREEEELVSWEKEIETIKSRIEVIGKVLFGENSLF